VTEQVLIAQLELNKPFGTQICQQMVEAIKKIGFAEQDIVNLPEFEQAEFSLIQDPYTADHNLMGSWYDDNKHRLGQIQFNSDGSFYAEYDIVQPHPSKKKWFVEGMSAWGNRGDIRTEAKLLPALE